MYTTEPMRQCSAERSTERSTELTPKSHTEVSRRSQADDPFRDQILVENSYNSGLFDPNRA
jgi:hypothetical protein